MAWPQSQDYNEAIQNPSTCFKDPDLKGGKPTLNALGVPLPCSGNFADVYQVTSANSVRWAVKCFTRGEPASLRRRYAEIDTHLQKARLPFAVGFQFLDQGIRVKGQWHPALKMQWVEGLTLNQFVRERLDKPHLLDGLLAIWARMGKRLREADLAHADLQHGNVLLVPGATANALGVKLIDYDGMWVPAMAGEQSGEVGHPAYQHPRRLQDGTYSREVDRFPLLVVAAALRCLRLGGKGLWEKYDTGDNLLFREEDLKEPGRSPLFAELRQLQDPQARQLVGKLEEACGRPLEQAPHLDELLPELAAPITARKPTAAAGSSAVTTQPGATGEPGSAFADLEAPEPASGRKPRRAREGRPERRFKWLPWAIGGGTVAAALLVGLVMALTAGKDPANPSGGEHAGIRIDNDRKDNDKKDAQGPNDKKNGEPPAQEELTLGQLPDLVLSPGEMRHVLVPIGGTVRPDDVRLEFHDLPAGFKSEYIGITPRGEIDWTLTVPESAPAGQSEVKVIATAGQLRTQRGFSLTVKGKTVAARPPTPTPLGTFVGRWEGEVEGLREVWTVEDRGGTPSVRALYFDGQREVGSFTARDARLAEGRLIYTQHYEKMPFGKNWRSGATYTCRIENGRLSYYWEFMDWPRQPSRVLKRLEAPATPVAAGKELRQMDQGQVFIRGSAFGADGSRAVGVGNEAVVWNVKTGARLARRAGVQGMAGGAALLPDGRRVVLPNHRTLELWDSQSEEVQTIGSHEARISALAVSADGSRALTASGDFVMDEETRKPKVVNGRNVFSDCKLRVWEVEKRKLLRSRELEFPAYKLSLSGDGRRALYSLSQRPWEAQLWDTETGQDLGRLDTRTGGDNGAHVLAVAMSPDGRLAALALTGHVVQVWDLSEVKPLRRIDGFPEDVRAVKLSADGRLLLTGGGRYLQPPAPPGQFENCVARLWEVSSGRELLRLEGHTRPVQEVAFSPVARYALTNGEDRTTRLWDLKPDAAPEPPPAVAERKRVKPPDEEKQKEALKLVRELFEDDYARTRTVDRLALADKLLAKARDSQEAAERFVLLQEAADVAAGAGGAAQALAALDLLAEEFEVDRLALKVKALTAAAAKVLPASTAGQKAVADAALSVLEDAVEAEQFEVATKLATVAETAARNARDNALNAAVNARVKEVREASKEAEAAKAAAEKLKGSPEDAGANLTRGKFLCFRLGDWQAGLPLLARGEDAPLKDLASADLKKSGTVDERIKLGDGWWELSKSRPELGKTEMLRRSLHWYRQALEGGVGGLVKDKVERQVKLVERELPPTRVVQAGGELRKFEGHTATVYGIAFLSAQTFVSCGDDGRPRVWNLDGKEQGRFFNLPVELKGVIAVDERRFVTVDRNGVSAWEVGDERNRGHGLSGRLSCIAPGGRGGRALVGSAEGNIWHVQENAGGGRIVDGRSPAGNMTCIASGLDGRLGLVGSESGALYLYNVAESRSKPARLGVHAGAVNGVAVSPDGFRAVSVGEDRTVRVWDLRSLRDVRRLSGHTGAAFCVAISEDGHKVVTGGADGTVRVWDLRTGQELRRFSGHKGKVTAVAFSPDGRKIVSGGEDKSVRLWGL